MSMITTRDGAKIFTSKAWGDRTRSPWSFIRLATDNDDWDAS